MMTRKRKKFDKPAGGLACEWCGSNALLVYRTIKGRDVIVRYRKCRLCGEITRSEEKVPTNTRLTRD